MENKFVDNRRFQSGGSYWMEVSGGSIARAIREYYARDDMELTGDFSLVYPRPFGNSVTEFMDIVNGARDFVLNKRLPYPVEEILTYEPGGETALDQEILVLTDIKLLKQGAAINFSVESDAFDRKLALQFSGQQYLQLVVSAKAGGWHRKIMVVLAMRGAIIYELGAIRDVKQIELSQIWGR